jgi:hypothetical protein
LWLPRLLSNSSMRACTASWRCQCLRAFHTGLVAPAHTAVAPVSRSEGRTGPGSSITAEGVLLRSVSAGLAVVDIRGVSAGASCTSAHPWSASAGTRSASVDTSCICAGTSCSSAELRCCCCQQYYCCCLLLHHCCQLGLQVSLHVHHAAALPLQVDVRCPRCLPLPPG